MESIFKTITRFQTINITLETMKRQAISIIVFLISFCYLHGQDYKIPLWEKNIPNFKQTDEKEEATSTDILKIKLVQKPDIAVFLPSRKNAGRQAVVICPGGGYVNLAYDWEGTDIAKWLNGNGIAAIVLKYRLPNSKSNITGHKSPLMDAQRALRMVRYHSAEWNIDSNRIGIMGFSAGGHLASTLGTHFDYGMADANDSIDKLSCRPDFMILMYPVISMDSTITHRGSMNSLLGQKPDPGLIEYYSNELHVQEDTPPTFIVHSGDDATVPVENSLRFYKALEDKKITVEMHLYPTGGHGFSLALDKGHLSSWTDRCIAWLKWVDSCK
jgi:acetyl esterase/lipase